MGRAVSPLLRDLSHLHAAGDVEAWQKNKALALTPHKISGACGRLMCCLRYEIDFYRDMNQRLPNPKSPVDTPEGPGHVIEVRTLHDEVIVVLGDGRRITVPGEDLRSFVKNVAHRRLAKTTLNKVVLVVVPKLVVAVEVAARRVVAVRVAVVAVAQKRNPRWLPLLDELITGVAHVV